ncbi:fungal pheromone mating factor STE2 GPCR-domain-containing protein [Amylocarpus encephaloides]|uniref:Fungal pheromone mating factor STE2 GPCR-domain-containing protein n=1 Tax=Amylocarpus encephaloides TaxID=45428 RepID=A0A9P7YJN0_9HELO|nr:fungal pheromone mating factor STE2 GPCR-domain-containing protein [Amylocarpus encephaloides]
MTAFDCAAQNLTIISAKGIPFNITLGQTVANNEYIVTSTLSLSAQAGACGCMLLAMLLLHPKGKDKRNSIFWLNVFSLVICIISRSLLVNYFTSNYVTLYSRASHDKSIIPISDVATSITSAIFPLLLTLTINSSLVLQVKGMLYLAGLPKVVFAWLVAISIFMWLLAVTFRILLVVTNINSGILENGDFFSSLWLVKLTLAVEMITILWFCSLFSFKLVKSLLIRKESGWRRQRAWEALVLGTFYTMFIPTIFAIVQIARPNGFREAGSWSLALTAIFLPLTTAWAKSIPQNDNNAIMPHRNVWGADSACSLAVYCTCGKCVCTGRGGSVSTAVGPSQTHPSRRASARGLDDLGAAELGDRDIMVNSTYNVEARRAHSDRSL